MSHICLHALLSISILAGGGRHGVEIRTELQPPVVLAFAPYSGGGPLASGDIRIMAPAGEEPYQTGKTDPNGVFAFRPDAAGIWQIEVDDGMGHHGGHEITLDASFFEGAAATPETPAGEEAGDATGSGPPWTQVILGVVLILGLTVVAYVFKTTRA